MTRDDEKIVGRQANEQQYSVLVIDDDPSYVRYLYDLLSIRGYRVFSARNGQCGLALFEEIRPDLVITDLLMAGVEGMEVIRQIRQESFRIPIIVLTGMSLLDPASCLSMAVSLGANEALRKPVEKDVLLSSVRRLLGRTGAMIH